MADPVAEKSGFLRMYMSNHPDTLVAYAKWFGKVTEPITSAEMSAIDCKGMTLSCTLKNGSKKDVRVPIEPPMSGYDDVKPRLLEMKAIAQEGLGMIKAPQIRTFHLPNKAIYPVILIGLFAYLAYSPLNSSSPLFLPAKLAAPYLGRAPDWAFKGLWVTHAFEALYTYILCRRHKTGFVVGAQYVIATLFSGGYIWLDLRRRIQDARIDSVMKVE
ncbi:hypothetical protein Moror_14830 [Moniliophthora roreri MCA 2997]|uniref:DUF2470 domain-containing protein n=2 Tax=Moniliophthora roreri TaxID=221103 RepID=V2WN82_MONRO|nr:hypothetical protein Moror_14830 [Moniliophthora roreri MCA 2997]KAI3607432.1 hypothetical protein WG66_004732 [Moniliophthora roreri]